ncbi:MAG: hypothetical protein R3F43_08850 [bacterium]
MVDLPLPASLLTRRALAEVTSPTPVATRAWVVWRGLCPSWPPRWARASRSSRSSC